MIVGSETFPAKIDVMWDLVTRLPHVIGDFTWTGWDYLGEAGIGRVDYTDVEGYEPTGTAGPYPYLLAECGDIDITGHRRTISYYREIVFGLRTDPYIAVHRPQHHGRPTATTPWSWDDSVSSWTWDAAPGAPVTVDVYADADEVELLLDGVSLGVTAVGGEKAFRARFETEYRPGELVAVARRAGVEVGRHAVRTASGDVAARGSRRGDGRVDGLGYVAITLEDETGTVFSDADLLVTVTVDGPGVLAGLGTGRARTEEPLSGSSVTTYDGRALAIVRPTGPGEITVTVTADGHEPVRAARGVGRARGSVSPARSVGDTPSGSSDGRAEALREVERVVPADRARDLADRQVGEVQQLRRARHPLALHETLRAGAEVLAEQVRQA